MVAIRRRELAGLVGVSQGCIGQIETGVRKSSPELALRLYGVLLRPPCTCASSG
jgi:DNA-binding XRE family transcriptional regulator